MAIIDKLWNFNLPILYPNTEAGSQAVTFLSYQTLTIGILDHTHTQYMYTRFNHSYNYPVKVLNLVTTNDFRFDCPAVASGKKKWTKLYFPELMYKCLFIGPQICTLPCCCWCSCSPSSSPSSPAHAPGSPSSMIYVHCTLYNVHIMCTIVWVISTGYLHDMYCILCTIGWVTSTWYLLSTIFCVL